MYTLPFVLCCLKVLVNSYGIFIFFRACNNNGFYYVYVVATSEIVGKLKEKIMDDLKEEGLDLSNPEEMKREILKEMKMTYGVERECLKHMMFCDGFNTKFIARYFYDIHLK